MITVAIYGAGQLGTSVAGLLRALSRYDVRGPFIGAKRDEALRSGADLVIIATTTRLADVADDIEEAVRSGSNVLVSAEEAAYPFVVDRSRAEHIATLAQQHQVTVAGTGVNPGLMFDSLVLTMLGAAPRGCTIHVRRKVDLSGFGATVLRRIGIGSTAHDFELAVRDGRILGHAGFPQSMAIVAAAIGADIDRISKQLRPIIAERPIDIPGRFRVETGQSAGVDQTYTAFVAGKPWFVAHFLGHVALRDAGYQPSDVIDLTHKRRPFQTIELRPGVDAQIGSSNMVANSVERVLAARPGWATVAEMQPAYPAPANSPATSNDAPA